jgi:Dyp-type peroxidase family
LIMAIPLDAPLDLNNPDAPDFLAGIQGNILKGHGRDHAALLFIRFGDNKAAARNVVAKLAGRVISADTQLKQRDNWKLSAGAGDLFCSVLLSYSGYLAIGIPEAEIPVEPGRTYFQRGMKRQAGAERPFNDPPSSQWETAYRGEVHALLILAHDDRKQLACEADQFCAEILDCSNSSVWREWGEKLEFEFPSGKKTIEHFGYEDGISNPLLILQDAEKERAERGFDQWDGTAPLQLALVQEPGQSSRFGSFFVIRKLEQNVRSFKHALEGVAAAIGDGDTERAGAMAVGRFRDGTPIIPTATPIAGATANNFNFKMSDPDGAKCPFHAHIRKTNPRGDTPLPPEVERNFRIVRRGITYGERPDLSPESTLDFPTQGVGLLFMSYQSRLDQFAIQQEGSDSNDFVSPGVGVDAVIGQNTSPTQQEWPAGSGNKFTMANFVRLLGGEYFFAPSMGFLREL